MQNQLVPKTMSLSQSKMSKGFAITKKYENMFDLSGQVVDTVRNIIAEFQKAHIKKKKRVNGTTSNEFVISVIYMALEIHQKGKNFKEVCAMSEVNEKKVRRFIKTINQTIPNKVKIHSRTPVHHIPEIAHALSDSIDLENSKVKIYDNFELERKAIDILSRAFDHNCKNGCSSKVISGKRPSTLAAAAVWIASEEMGITFKPEDVSCCAQIGKETMLSSAEIIREHWDAMEM